MDDRRPHRAAKNSGMPVSSLFLATTFHASVVLAFLWTPPAKMPALMPDDVVEVTIERQAAPLAVAIQPMSIPELPVDDAPIQPPAPVLGQTIFPESIETPTLEKAVAELDPAPEPTLHEFVKLEPIVPKVDRKKPSPKPDPNADLDKAFVPPPGWTPPTASAPTPFLNPADIIQRNKAADDYLARVARKISQYRHYNNQNYTGKLFTTLVIARDGRLVTAAVLIPSEQARLDAEVMDTIRLAAPYDPLPDRIEGEHATFVLPCQYVIRIWH